MSTPNYGLDADLAARQAAKYDKGLEKEVCDWIEAITGNAKGETDVQEWLKDGHVLCSLMNGIVPGKIKKVNTSSLAFKQMENITFFMNACRDIGVPESLMFGTPDLYENKNMGSVISCIYTFGGVVQSSMPDFTGPKLGVPINAEIKDEQRTKVMATQGGGISGTCEQQSAHTGKRVAGEAPKSPGAPGAASGYAAGGDPVKAPPPEGADAVGLDADLKAARDAKYDHGLEREVVDWIQAVTGEQQGDKTVGEWLKDGHVLCALGNAVKPGSIKKVNTSSLAFKQMENITYFINVARDIGVPESSVFGTPDLYEEKNMGSVISCIYTFGGAVQVSTDFSGPKLGVALNVASDDKARDGRKANSQYEAMQRTMQVERPKDGGITRGA